METLKIAHSHYDHTDALLDPNVVMPLKGLNRLKDERVIGSVADHHYSFSGFILDVIGLKENLTRMILKDLKEQGVDCVVLSPA